MVSNADKITLFPAVFMFALSAYLAFLDLQITDSPTKPDLLNYATVSFIVGVLLIAAWIVIYIIRQGSENG
jgi:hypothetical protein